MLCLQHILYCKKKKQSIMKFYLASKFLLSLGLVIVFIFLVKGNLKNISLERVKEKN
jgi:hypothetical protein